jgi:hypothetical protein
MRGRSLLLCQDVDTIQDVPQLSRALRRADRLLEEVDEEVGGWARGLHGGDKGCRGC